MADLERIGETINPSFRRYPPIFDHRVRNASTIETYYHISERVQKGAI